MPARDREADPRNAQLQMGDINYLNSINPSFPCSHPDSTPLGDIALEAQRAVNSKILEDVNWYLAGREALLKKHPRKASAKEKAKPAAAGRRSTGDRDREGEEEEEEEEDEENNDQRENRVDPQEIARKARVELSRFAYRG
ncbi:hypothetical protein BJ508DRAFT_331850 [Ascobolus immersus RN42]|uniref:Uncharacterized protein n=1 Tax=Ascobolus immersus RN42 TaxID=1160509 RepID=A0A3N4HR12_ASCIM|nr:hypothetical protein BJ508DRAFT_331850 [Ascobolus immersus RN42]